MPSLDLATAPAPDLTAADLHATDPMLIDGAVQWLNRALRSSGLQLAIEVSQYVVDTFFGGDFELLSSTDPHKTASYADLCARPDLQMGKATLNRLVRIGHQAGRLPGDLAQRLELSHHRALLTVDNQQRKQHLARQTVQRGWTVAELEARIRAEKPQDGKPRGRPPLAPVLKWLGGVKRKADAGMDAPTFAAGFATLPPDEQVRTRAELAALRGTIDALLGAVGAA